MTPHPKPTPREKATKPLRRKAALPRGKTRLQGKYLKAAWRNLRARVLRRDGSWCRGCNAAPATQVHHTAYGRGNGLNSLLVPMDQLVSVCAACHAKHHPWMEAPC